MRIQKDGCVRRRSNRVKQWIVKFNFVRNDGKRESSFLIVPRIKNIFVKQLPDMTRTHACRLLLNQKHESFAVTEKCKP